LYAGLDVSDKTTAVCLIDDDGKTIVEASVESTPVAIARALAPYKRVLAKVGHESGAKASWLHQELMRRRYPVVCMDARTVHGALSTQRNKTDKNDARGLAQVLRNGWYTTAYVRGADSFRLRTLLSCRRQLVRKAWSIDLSLRGSLKVIGAHLERKKGKTSLKQARGSDALIAQLADSMLRAKDAINKEVGRLETIIEKLVKADPVCKRLMTVPGVGPITALSFRAAIDDPHRFASSRNVAAHFGLTPRRFQSGQTDIQGHISRMGDESVRTALYQAAFVLLTTSKSTCALKRWGDRLYRQKGLKLAAIAVARKLAVILHRMWITEKDFDPSTSK
jgi:transposase